MCIPYLYYFSLFIFPYFTLFPIFIILIILIVLILFSLCLFRSFVRSLWSGLHQGPVQWEGKGTLIGRGEGWGADAAVGGTPRSTECPRRWWKRRQHRGRPHGCYRQWTLGHPGQRRTGETQEGAYGKLAPSITLSRGPALPRESAHTGTLPRLSYFQPTTLIDYKYRLIVIYLQDDPELAHNDYTTLFWMTEIGIQFYYFVKYRDMYRQLLPAIL